MRTTFISIAVIAALSMSACTADQIYGMGQGWQRNQCTKLPDKTEVDRCMDRADGSYDSYKRQAEAERRN